MNGVKISLIIGISMIAGAAGMAEPMEWGIERLSLPDLKDESFLKLEKDPEVHNVISMDVDLDNDGVVERLVTYTRIVNASAGFIWRVFDQHEGRYKLIDAVCFPLSTSGTLAKPYEEYPAGFYSAEFMSGPERQFAILFNYKVTGGKLIKSEVARIEPLGKDKVFYKLLTANQPKLRRINAGELYEKYPDPSILMHLWLRPNESLRGTGDQRKKLKSGESSEFSRGGRDQSEKDNASDDTKERNLKTLVIGAITFMVLFVGYVWLRKHAVSNK